MTDVPITPASLIEECRAQAGQGQAAQALAAAQAGQAEHPDHPELTRLIADLAQSLDDHQTAQQALERLSVLLPTDAGVWNDLGILHHRQGRLEDAERCYRRSLLLDPTQTQCANNLAVLLNRQERRDEAEHYFRQALTHAGSRAGILANLGNLLLKQRRLDEAERCYEDALKEDPALWGAWHSLGTLAEERRDLGLAEQRYRTALAAQPDNQDYLVSLAMALLKSGQWTEGWQAYEARHGVYPSCAPPPTTEAAPLPPLWQGDDLAGKRIMIWPEQGLGDEIQFLRFIPLLRERGASRVILYCKPELKALFAGQGLADRVLGSDEWQPDQADESRRCDCWTWTMSLPRTLGITLDNLPARLPYLRPLADRLASWAPPPGRLRVGLVWKGNPQHSHDHVRSLPGLAALAPLWQAPGITFVSLQKGGGEDEAQSPPDGQPLLPLGGRLRDFSDTAALISRLDLVIGVDTAVLHLAGALGKPCWMLLPAGSADWRWLEGREDSPWYPGVLRLWRQADGEPWPATLTRLAAALADWAASHPPPAQAVDPMEYRDWSALLYAQGRDMEALQVARQALENAPEDPALLVNAGVCAAALGDQAYAEQVYRRALERGPEQVETLYNLGNLLRDDGREAAAEELFRRAILLQPQFAPVSYNLGNLLNRQGRHAEAEQAYRQALASENPDPGNLNNLGADLEGQGAVQAAEQAYRGAIAVSHHHFEAHNNLGALLMEQGRFEESAAQYAQALAMQPESLVVKVNQSMLFLKTGRLREGWQAYEARLGIQVWDSPSPPMPAGASLPPTWQGEDLQGRRIMIWPEQGYGDEIQFLRFLPLLRARGAGRILLYCKPALRTLFAAQGVADEVISQDDWHPRRAAEFDCWRHIMSLALHFDATLDHLPATIPYLTAPTERLANWPLPQGRPRVGLSWKGRPSHKNDARRSLSSLTRLAPLWRVPDIAFISLQKGQGEDEACQPPPDQPLLHLGSHIRDFADAAALLRQLDLLICVDTAYAHLAGALGVPCWVLLPFHNCDWRWLSERDDSPWYPGGLRLFRQQRDGAWDEVIERVTEALAAWRGDQPAPLPVPLDLASAYYDRSVQLMLERRHGEAETALRQSLALRPEAVHAQHNLGVALKELGRADEAEAAYRRALDIDPDFAGSLYNLALLLKEQGRYAEAEQFYRRTLALLPDHVTALNNLGNLLNQTRRREEAEAVLRRALELEPDHALARLNLSLSLLAQGRLAEGWEQFEARQLGDRWQHHTVPPPLDAPGFPPAWEGAPLEGKSLLIWPEQGHGDEIQFLRYLPLLRQRGVRHITLVCKSPLAPLFAAQGLAEQVVALEAWRDDLVAGLDYWSHPLSLPRHFGHTLDNLPASLPYLSPPRDRIAAWRTRLPERGLRVGLVWKGEPRHSNNARRSLPSLAVLAPLWRAPGITFISLQKGAGEDEAAAPPPAQPLLPLGGAMKDFADAAALTAQLDLVISVDTAAVHLAGALGKPCWVLLPWFGSDWRWLEGREDSPWYPGVLRLFRQEAEEGWEAVATRVAEALTVWAGDLSGAPAQMSGAQPQDTATDPDEAALRARLEASPQDIPAHLQLSVLLSRQSRIKEAEALYLHLIQSGLSPADGYTGLGRLCTARGEWDKAASALRQALALQPDSGVAHSNLAGALIRLADQHGDRRSALETEAAGLFARALDLAPDAPLVWANQGTYLHRNGDDEGAAQAYQQALQRQPGYPQALHNLSHLLLKQGRYREGWAAYESRCDPQLLDSHTRPPPCPAGLTPPPVWRGEPLAGKALLLWPEQGYGDLLQFLRYLPWLRDRGLARLTLVCPEPLQALCAFQGLADEVIALPHWRPEALAEYDFWLHPLSLAQRFDTTLDNLPASLPYLKSDPERRARWTPRIPQAPLRIGLVWQGRASHINDRHRSIPHLSLLAALWSVPDIAFVSLQMGPGADPEQDLPLTPLGRDIADFADSAAIVDQLDLVICVDTAIAHLAGALGRPCWVLLPAAGSDWRWLTGRDDSPWYPGVLRLFRLAPGEAWPALAERVAAHLSLWAQDRADERREGPRNAEWHIARSALLYTSGHTLAALEAARAGLALGHDRPALWNNAGLFAAALGRNDYAETAYRRALALNPAYPQAAFNLGLFLMQGRRYRQAEVQLRHALSLQPDYLKAQRELVKLLMEEKRLGEADEAIQRLLELVPDDAQALAHLGSLRFKQNRFDEAESAFQRALEIKPDYPQAWINLGLLRWRQGRSAEAESHYLHALGIHPDTPPALINLGVLRLEQDRYNEAETLLRRAIELGPTLPGAHNNLCALLQHLGRYREAEESARSALTIQPDFMDARFNLSLLLLRQGRYQEAWPDYEARHIAALDSINQTRLSPDEAGAPVRWDGAPLTGRSILIWTEQGLGDQLQFVRFLPLLRRLGARWIGFLCRDELAGLFAGQGLADQIIPLRQWQPEMGREFDCWEYLCSLPLRLDIRLDALPASLPYLHPDPVRAARWRERLSAMRGVRIGLAWKGSPIHKNDRHRSLPSLSTLAPLWRLPDVHFISLQKGAGEDEAAAPPPDQPLLDLGGELADMADTAALIEQLDLVLCVDSAVAHLAGALGKPCWTLLPPWGVDWRWLEQSDDSPWYPGVLRLVRRTAPEGLGPFIERLAQGLDIWLNARRQGTDTPEDYLDMSQRWHEQGQSGPALEAARLGAALAPHHPELLNTAGALAWQRREPDYAESCFRRVLADAPDHPDALSNLALAELRKGRPRQAEASLRRALYLVPEHVQAWYNLAQALRDQDHEIGPGQEAERAYRRCLELDPNHDQAFNNLGSLLDLQGRHDEAEACYRRALTLNPGNVKAHYNLGVRLQARKALEAGAQQYQIALELRPDLLEAWQNLGSLRIAQGRHQEALTLFRQALALKPDNPDVEYNLGYLLLLLGRYREGWPLYGRRDAVSPTLRQTLPPPEPPPEWRGEPLSGHSILVWTEQGHGDEIQFLRYLPRLRERGAGRITLVCKPALYALFAAQGVADEVVNVLDWFVARGREFDAWCYPASLPRWFDTTVETIPARLPYLTLPEARIPRWRDRLEAATPPGTKLRIGLVWKGAPTHPRDAERSLPGLATLAPLWRIPGVAFFSLQKGVGEDVAETPPPDQPLAAALGREIADFADSAVLISEMDLLISVDTAAVHLAGALGKPCWVLLNQFNNDWRWLESGEESPWYPGVLRLYRQAEQGDWSAPVERMAADLRDLSGLASAGNAGETAYLRGLALCRQHRWAEAEEALRACLEQAPAPAKAFNQLGIVLARQGRMQEAEACYRQALEQDPNHLSALSNLGVLCHDLHRDEESERILRHALALDPLSANARANLAFSLLRRGDLSAGWAAFEARTEVSPEARSTHTPPVPEGGAPPPRWRGEPLAGRSLLVWPEQGHGDDIQFVRLLPQLQERGVGRLTLVCKDALFPLLAAQPLADETVAARDWPPHYTLEHDLWVPLASLPGLCGVTLDRLPAALPYLRPPAERTLAWSRRLNIALPSDAELRVGLVWKGNPGHRHDAERSLSSLAALAPLWNIPGIVFISLQKGAGEEEARTPPDGQPIATLGDSLADFADSAAVVAQLDLVICVDTAIAHLAGALGKPCWVLIPWLGSDWRWLEHRPDSPWYPGVLRLFRQEPGESWDAPITRLAAALAELAQIRRATLALNAGIPDLARQGRLEEATTRLREALELDPYAPALHCNLAQVRMLSGDLDGAERSSRRAIELDPGQASAWLNLGAALLKQAFDAPDVCFSLDVVNEMEGALRRAIELDPALAEAHHNLALMQMRIGDPSAEDSLRQTLALNPESQAARFHLGLLLLRQQRFTDGFAAYEARHAPGQTECIIHAPPTPESGVLPPPWQGQDLTGRALLIWPEQGYGDQIQFVRYLPLLHRRGLRRLTLACWPPLAPLLRDQGLADEVIPTDQWQPEMALEYDCWSYLLSLPHLLSRKLGGRTGPSPALGALETGLETLPLPYLHPAPDRREHWRSLLPDAGPRIGLVWRGSTGHRDDARRSLPGLDALAPLWQALPGGVFISLQKGAGQAEAEHSPPGQPLIALGGDLEDFADTAALISLLDLVICVDTGVAHLAGALGKRCWVMLPAQGADWRWFEDREDSPWYPEALRLFRALPQERGWDGVIARVARALEILGLPLAEAPAMAQAEALNRQSISLLNAEAPDPAAAAEPLLREALTLYPRHPSVQYHLGLALQRLGRNDEAESAYRTALELRPDNIPALNNLSVLLFRQGRDGEAETLLRRALTYRPDDAMTHGNLGVLRARQGRRAPARLTEAAASFRRAIESDPGHVHALNNLAGLYFEEHRDAEAEPLLRQALARQPQLASARLNLSHLLLRRGDYREGWNAFESRLQLSPEEINSHPPPSPSRGALPPLWQGEPLGGASLLVWPEQGQGDILQFVRYLPLARQCGAGRITLVAPQALHPLLIHQGLADQVLNYSDWQHDDCLEHDRWCFLLSLPRLCNAPEPPGSALPYLRASPAAIAAWEPRLPQRRPRVGLVWQGNPKHDNDARRSLPGLASLAPLWSAPDVAFVSLQMGEGAAEAARPSALRPLTALGQAITDFNDSAAIVAQLDLLICVDTAPAHLAGALGKPCWVMIPWHGSDWRWMEGRQDSPWYPGVLRLFRQGPEEDWGPVIGRLAQALTAWAMEQEGQDAAAWLARGNELLGQGDHAGAEAAYSQALQQAPGLAPARVNLGVSRYQRGDIVGAEAIFRQAMEGHPDLVDPAYNLGALLQTQGRAEEAETVLRQALILAPTHPDARLNLGILLKDQGRDTEADALCRQGMELGPADPRLLGLHGVILERQGRRDEAEVLQRQALILDPDSAEILNNLAALMLKQDRDQEAEPLLRRALALDEGCGTAHGNLGSVLARRNQDEAAEAHYRRALELAPRNVEAINNYGALCLEQHRFTEAESFYRHALSIKPDYPDARANLGYLLLGQGRYEEGWAAHVGRHLALQPPLYPPPPVPQGAALPAGWRGEPLEGRSLLLWPEQGYGDILQFVRFLPRLRALGAGRITLACRPALIPLLAGQGLADQVADQLTWRPEQTLEHDCWCYLLDLGLYCGITLESLPATPLPYLHAPQERLALWASRLPTNRPRIGLAWKGNPHHRNDTRRSLPSLSILAPLWSVADVQFISLQKGPGEEEALASVDQGQPLIALGGEVADFADAAALTTQLDLLICVDTALAHLAGALGKRCWMLLPWRGVDWRWLQDREDSPWYPGAVRLFRQGSDEDWEPVILAVAQALADWRQDPPHK